MNSLPSYSVIIEIFFYELQILQFLSHEILFQTCELYNPQFITDCTVRNDEGVGKNIADWIVQSTILKY